MGNTGIVGVVRRYFLRIIFTVKFLQINKQYSIFAGSAKKSFLV